jgi:hypothetical protein
MSRLVLCGLVATTEIVVPGSVQRPCVHCQAQVWVSPSSLAAEQAGLAKGEPAWTPICMDCAGRNIPPGGYNPTFVPGQFEELQATFNLLVGKRGSS